MGTDTREPSGRVRFRKEQAQIYWHLLWGHYGVLIHDRWLAKQRGQPLAPHQRALAQVEHMKNELLRTADEMGWVLDEQRDVDPEGAGVVGAPEEREQLG